ncbi:MAG: peptidylprolyl isomerase [Bacteroidales bacterium]|jgi:peptidyl-prolyl cis-trans isomerase B (cyclophilin B)|nr:peptidylprolyl isomerase [Bacteroidales bacterium]
MKQIFLTLLTLISFSCMTSSQSKTPVVVIHTTFGDMKVKLYDETPQHRDNFLKLVQEGFYDELLFHRVINEFMIQGGDPDSRSAIEGQRLGGGGLDYTIPAEFNTALYHKKGALAAARMGDNVNPEKRSSGCQFYIVQGKRWLPEEIAAMKSPQYGFKFTPEAEKVYQTVGGTPFLDGQYTVFGEVIEGLDVIDKITSQPTDGNDRPLKNILMSITVEE